jgi:hypothetical protein
MAKVATAAHVLPISDSIEASIIITYLLVPPRYVGSGASISPLPEWALLFRDLYLELDEAPTDLAGLASPLRATLTNRKTLLGFLCFGKG